MAGTKEFLIRPHIRADAKQLLGLMKKLAKFEGYIDDFNVNEAAILKQGFGENPLFHAFVAESSGNGKLIGMAISYVLSWTYDLKPTLVLKELFVEDHARGLGVGQALMGQIALRAAGLNAARVQWTVLSGNEKAASFYSMLNGNRDEVWEPWLLNAQHIDKLAHAAKSFSNPHTFETAK
jgi:GNAT superfamily N-acetyltransferase